MEVIAWIVIALLLIFLVVALMIAFSKKHKKSPPDYKQWFFIGIIWIIIGLPLALSHKKEWKKYKRPKISRKQKILKILLIILAFLIAFALGVFVVLRY